MARIVIVGNASVGKSTLARRLASARGLRHVEVERLLWRDGWVPIPAEDYDRRHEATIAGEGWVMDGLGRRDSIPRRIERATEVVLVDMPLWMHFRLAAERQIAWIGGTLDQAPGGIAQAPPIEGLFRSIWEVDRDWMPGIRGLCGQAEARGARVTRLGSVAELDAFSPAI